MSQIITGNNTEKNYDTLKEYKPPPRISRFNPSYL